jgi:hypothetical protein
MQVAAFHSQLKVLELLRSWKDGNPVLPVEESDTDDASESSSDQGDTSDSEDGNE